MASIALTPQQTQFVQRLRARTGLNSRVLSAWVLAEEGGASSGAAKKRVAARNNNWLNVGYFDSGAGKLTKDKTWQSPVKAADATADFLLGKRFGASSGIRKILSTAGGSQDDQIRAIAGSGWASSGYNGGQNLKALLGSAPAPGSGSGQVSAGMPGAAAVAGSEDKGGFDAAAATQALAGSQAQAQQIIASLGQQQAPPQPSGPGLQAPGFSADPGKLAVGQQVAPAAAAPRAAQMSPDQNAQMAAAATAAQAYAQIQQLNSTGVKVAGQVASPATNDGKLAALIQRANTVDSKHLPYQWGGGHGGKVTVGKGKLQALDCSGAVSAVLGIDPRVSGEFEHFGTAGDGGNKGVTIYANGEHVLMKINGHFFGTSKSNPGGGAGWIPSKAISPEYLKRFTARHVKRLV